MVWVVIDFCDGEVGQNKLFCKQTLSLWSRAIQASRCISIQVNTLEECIDEGYQNIVDVFPGTVRANDGAQITIEYDEISKM